MSKAKWKLVGGGLLCAMGIVAGLQIIAFGEIALPRGEGVRAFNGLERLMGLIPMAIGAFLLLGVKESWKKETEKERGTRS